MVLITRLVLGSDAGMVMGKTSGDIQCKVCIGAGLGKPEWVFWAVGLGVPVMVVERGYCRRTIGAGRYDSGAGSDDSGAGGAMVIEDDGSHRFSLRRCWLSCQC